ncbi:MAG: transposase [Ignavibacteriales bacterium]|nr:transposase [Ignavibacteriales bacterium]
MPFEKDKFYHLYNRSNNNELVFIEDTNYLFFLKKFKKLLKPFCAVIAYCLMPTHFHFLIRSETEHSDNLSSGVAVLLRSYTHAINIRYRRHGNLFQQNTKAKIVEDESYLLTLINYIHQNPLRAKLVENIGDWKYSSYLDLTGKRNGSLPDKNFLKQYFKASADFERYSQKMVVSIRKEYWM